MFSHVSSLALVVSFFSTALSLPFKLLDAPLNAFTQPLNRTHVPFDNLTLPNTPVNPGEPEFQIVIANAILRVRQKYNTASLVRIECTSIFPTITPHLLLDIRLWFALPSPTPIAPPSSIVLPSRSDATGWGQWGMLQHISKARPASEMALKPLRTDIVAVVDKLQQAGHKGRFDAVDVIRERGSEENWWEFQMSRRGAVNIWVGDETGRVVVGTEQGPGRGTDVE